MHPLKKCIRGTLFILKSLIYPVLFDASYYQSKNHLRFLPKKFLYPHFLLLGSWLKLDPHPAFDTAFYELHFPKKLWGPFWHYKIWGGRQNLSPCPYFDAKFYTHYLHLKKDMSYFAGMTPLEHYLCAGWKKLYPTSAFFSGETYYELNSDAALSRCNPLVHFLTNLDRPWMRSKKQEERVKKILLDHSPLSVFLATVFTPFSLENGQIFQELEIKTSNFQNSIFYRQENPEDAAFQISKLKETVIFGGSRLVATLEGAVLNPDQAQIQTTHLKFIKKFNTDLPKGILLPYSEKWTTFHWLTHTLPCVLMAEEAKVPHDVPLLLPLGIEPCLLKILDAINLSHRPIVKLENHVAYSVEDLYIPAWQKPREFLFSEKFTEIIYKRFPLSPVHSKNRHYYLEAKKEKQSPWNEHPLKDEWFDRGFEILDLKGISLPLLGKTLASTHTIVTTLHDHCAHLMFCTRGTRVLLIPQKENPQLSRALESLCATQKLVLSTANATAPSVN